MQIFRSPSSSSTPSPTSSVLVNIPPLTEIALKDQHHTIASPPSAPHRSIRLASIAIAAVMLLLVVVALVAAPQTSSGSPLHRAPKKPSLLEGRAAGRRRPDSSSFYIVDDMIIPTEGNRNRRAVSRDPSRLWDEAIVPYAFADTIGPSARIEIRKSMKHYEERTCLRFVPYTVRGVRVRGNDHILFNSTGNCQSFVGRKGGKQEIHLIVDENGNVSRKCSIIHEIGHAIGFWHEHTRPDRDDYVQINWENMREPSWRNFCKLNKWEINSFGGKYDFDSVMHYGTKTFSKNGKETISVKGGEKMSAEDRKLFVERMGQRGGLSEGDIKQANSLYRCKERTMRKWPSKYIRSGDTIALRFVDHSATLSHLWLTCPQTPGESWCGRPKSSCAGYAFDDADRRRCNTETFRIRASNRRDGEQILVGDTISLESGVVGSGNVVCKHRRCRTHRCTSSPLPNDEESGLCVDERKFVVDATASRLGSPLRDQDTIGLRKGNEWMACRQAAACRLTSCANDWTKCTGVPFLVSLPLPPPPSAAAAAVAKPSPAHSTLLRVNDGLIQKRNAEPDICRVW